MMEFKVKRIHLTAESGETGTFDPRLGNTDVVVFLENGKKYIASFFSYANIEQMRLQNQATGNFLNGSYFWDQNMVLVEECTLKIIEPVISDLIDEGNFQEAFKQL
jgi:hypothetical protein